MHIVWPLILGPKRGLLLVHRQRLSAIEPRSRSCQRVLTPAELLARAWVAPAISLATRNALRYARLCVTQTIKRMMVDDLGFGLA